eukprot:gnl/MRDRNA2_/MRDRNA2_91698_c0_seq1.p1 gnl/MRDRNA2_/MRDRNA2_91698_c0~~gnl/MRDRNA2_/MRDRNA2_91698_c0_seq1.p1  ORF type:complete len:222 (-),score=49.24 gnl/MRDRNA2_/MRDRNA2_91698_c0_seq1:120-785(-)
MVGGCQVLPGIFGIAVQGLLFFCSVGILVLKKYREKSDRTWFEFGLDSSKQLFGAGWIHIMNLLFAQQLERRLAGRSDECDWYWVNIMVDTTLGVYVEYLLLAFITTWILRGNDFKSGDYMDETGAVIPRKYVKQLIVWLFVVTGMKMCMLALMLVGRHQFETAATFILAPVNNIPTLKLLTVMIATPVCMNAFQFWVVDNIIKKKADNEPELSQLLVDGK